MYENALRPGIEYSMEYASADYILQSSIEYSIEYASAEYKSVIPAQTSRHLQLDKNVLGSGCMRMACGLV